MNKGALVVNGAAVIEATEKKCLAVGQSAGKEAEAELRLGFSKGGISLMIMGRERRRWSIVLSTKCRSESRVIFKKVYNLP